MCNLVGCFFRLFDFFMSLNCLLLINYSRFLQHSKPAHQTQNNHSQFQSRQVQHNHGHNNHNHGHRHRGRGRAHYRRHFDRVRHAESTPRWQWARDTLAAQIWSGPLFALLLSVYNILISISSIIVNVIYNGCLSSSSSFAAIINL